MWLIWQYYFWLALISAACFAAERIWGWRKDQRALRPGFAQDLFWLVFNGHVLGLLLAQVTVHTVQATNQAIGGLGLSTPESLALVSSQPLWLQFIVFFIAKDFLEWNIHRMLHNVPFLWQFHKLHHSIEELDWIGNFRFHWGEVIVYKTLTYLPLVILGVDGKVLLVIAVLGTLMQDLNHANLPLDWGRLRFVLNSPKMHVWHHDVALHGRGGQNFGIVLSVWDWIFGTVYWPKDRDRPERWGFEGMEQTFPSGLLGRLLYPFLRPKRK